MTGRQLVAGSSGRAIRLGSQLGKGGEGAVYDVPDVPGKAAKIYLQPLSKEKVLKLKTMTRHAAADLLKVAAWPTELLQEGPMVRGFLMPKVAAKQDIHELYSPKSRAQAFPNADLRFIVHVAANIARAFTLVHAQGHVVGDINHGNILVGPDGTVVLIDCDSFQIRDQGSVYSCDVGVPLFTAPELHGRAFRGLERSPNHDAFGLAVLIFHMLCLGRHPFAGRYAGGDMPIERAIAEYRFAYGGKSASVGMQRPPGTLALEKLGPMISGLFEAAFGKETSSNRPSALKWVSALRHLGESLTGCKTSSAHHYPAHLTACCWCEIEQATGARLFGQRIAAATGAASVDVAALWRAIVAVPPPGPEPALPSRAPPLSTAMKVERGIRILRKLASLALFAGGLAGCSRIGEGEGLLFALGFFVVGFAAWPRLSEQEEAARRSALEATRQEWQALAARWQSEAATSTFTQELQLLEKARNELTELPKERERRLAVLFSEREKRQRERYLDRFHIDHATIPNIGLGRKAMLASYGIETAADIERARIMSISGFGESLTRNLLDWRKGHEGNFRFNPSESIDPTDAAAVERDITTRRQKLLQTLQQGPQILQRKATQINEARARLQPLLESKWTAFKIAQERAHGV
jgi:DNA-binding helix-hairpin-helix protein with protein kinase domain